jgi:O-methyltransferase
VIGLDLDETQTPDVLILNRIPYSKVFSQAAAVVIHGGIGTAGIALAAGKPMLVVPGSRSDLMSYAQPDNAARLARLGVARVLQRANFNAHAVASELATLLGNPAYAKAGNDVSESIRREDGARVACDVIQRTITKRTRPRRGKSVSSNGQSSTASSGELTRATYLHLLKKTLTRYPLEPSERLMFVSLREVQPSLTNQIVQWGITSSSGRRDAATFNPVRRAMGMEWPEDGETMIGLYRLNNLEQCIISVIKQNVPGDLMETGVWRGGASIFMRAVLQAYGDRNRKVWLADSFQGLPKPDAETYPVDLGSDFWIFPELAVPLEKVKANFARYGLLDDQVRFLPGWFRDTLPSAPIDRLAVLRLDGDMYESTIVALRSLYDKVSAGGFVIVDDYFCFDMCRKAVDDFRAEENIVEPLCQIDWTGVYWQVSKPASDRL